MRRRATRRPNAQEMISADDFLRSIESDPRHDIRNYPLSYVKSLCAWTDAILASPPRIARGNGGGTESKKRKKSEHLHNRPGRLLTNNAEKTICIKSSEELPSKPSATLAVAAPSYERILENIWLCRKQKVDMPCENFGIRKKDECIFNNEACIMCSNSCGRECDNTPFKSRLMPNTATFQTEMNGTGLRAEQDIKDGEFVSEYIGEIINLKQMNARCKKLCPSEKNHYILMLNNSRGLFIDARVKGNLARFMNSSCKPNCETQVWIDEDTQLQHVGIFAVKDIKAGEELTFNYHFQNFDKSKFDCRCDVCVNTK